MEIDDQKLNIVSEKKAMAEHNEEIEKDSGIEESMETSPQSETQLQKEDIESDSDDEICVRSHQRQSRVIVDDDDDDDSNNMIDIDADNDDNNMDDPVPEDSAAAAAENYTLVIDDNEESEDEDSMLIIKRKKKSPEKPFQNLFADDDNLPPKDSFQTLDPDIFDANGSDSEDGSSSKDSFDDNEREDDDAEFDIGALSAKLKAKLMKGAKKNPKIQKARASKTKAEEKLELHSETQRIIRESKVHIPYHQPEPKSLNDFLNRAMRKQQQYRSLKNTFQDEQKKVEFVQDTIMNDSILFKKTSSESATQNSQEDSSQSTEATAEHNSEAQSQSQAPKLSDPSNGDAVIINLDSETPSEGPENSSMAQETKEPEINPEAKENDEDDDELPDLIISEEPVCKEDSTKNVPEPEIFEAIPLFRLTENTDDSVPEKGLDDSVPEKGMDDSSAWAIDENGSLTMDDPLMVELVTGGGKTESSQANDEASLGNGDMQEEKEIEKSEESKEAPTQSKLSVAQLLTPEIKSIKPKLSGSWDKPIVFDDNQEEKEEETVKNKGIDKLMQRLLEHSNVQKEPKESKKVNIKIVQKEQTTANKQELCLNTVTYQTDEPEEIKLKADKPGAKLLLLKDKLQQQMRIKRDSARQKRCEIFNLNNEDGYDAQEEENGEEEEAELTDGSDTDVSEEDLIENDLGEDYGKEKRSHSAFVDEEAEEEEEEEEECDEDADGDGEEKSDIQSKKKCRRDDEEEEEVLFDSSSHSEGESDSDSFIPESQNRPRIKKIIKNLILSDEESQDANIQYKDEKAEKDPFQKTDFLGTFSSTNTNNDLEPKTPSSAPIIRPLIMPAEDSQDLYKSSSDFQSPDLNSQNLRFPLESQASPMFDEQGFLRVKTLTKVHEPKISALDELCDNDDKADDILGLCSGQFAGTQDDRMKSCRTLFTDSQSDSQFPASGPFPFSCEVDIDGKKTAEGDEETEDFPSLKLISDDEDDDYNREKDNNSENDEEEEDDNNDDTVEEEMSEEEEDNNNNHRAFPKFRMKSMGKIRREFVDEEAELSGSEFDSDENDDLNDEFDVMEEEEGDQDVKLTDDQLRDQVGRVHLKNMIDDDKREVMRLQEMYLPDGDLFSEGHGRTRRFRWKNLDDNSQQDMFNTESETEEKEEEENDELKWRIERFEREKWIQEQEAQEKKNEEESPFLKYGRVFLKKKGAAGQNVSKKLPVTATESPKQSKFKMIKKGSFLSRSGDSLAKIAEMTKPVSNQTVTSKTNGRNFVFSVVTPKTEEEKASTTGPEKRKKPAESRSCQPAKKRKIEPVKRTLSETSVFRHLDKSFT